MDIKTVSAEELLQSIRQKQSFFSMRLRKHPEQARVFRKYGPPEQVAALLREGSGDVFFDNGTMCMTAGAICSGIRSRSAASRCSRSES